MQQKENTFLFAKLKFIPQVSLLHVPKSFFKIASDEFLKRIICQKQFCFADKLCQNCQKLKDNCYFDLNQYKFNQNNLMKKQDVVTIISTLSQQSLETNNAKICLIEEIEYASLEAANSFLKFLENLPKNTFMIFISENIEKVLPTIKSRSQVFNCSQLVKSNNFNENNFLIVEHLLEQFISNDNLKKFSNNFFLIKEIIALKANVNLFFQFLLLLVENKLIKKNNFDSNHVINKLVKSWINNDQIFLINLSESIIKLINKFTNTKNINLNLLLNHFFITIYQGQKNGW